MTKLNLFESSRKSRFSELKKQSAEIVQTKHSNKNYEIADIWTTSSRPVSSATSETNGL